MTASESFRTGILCMLAAVMGTLQSFIVADMALIRIALWPQLTAL